MKKKLFLFFLIMILLMMDKSWAETRTYGGNTYYSIEGHTFLAGTVKSYTETIYQTCEDFSVTIVLNNNDKYSGTYTITYNTDGKGVWEFNSIKPEDIAKKIGGDALAKQIYNEGAVIYINPKFHFYKYTDAGFLPTCRHASKSVVKTTDTGSKKIFYFRSENLTPEALLSKGGWTKDTQEGIKQQRVYIEVGKKVQTCNHILRCDHGGFTEDNHSHTYQGKTYRLTDKSEWPICTKCGNYRALKCRSDDQIPTPPTTSEEHNHNHWHRDVGSEANDSEIQCYHNAQFSKEYLIPGDTFSLNGNGHIYDTASNPDAGYESILCGWSCDGECGGPDCEYVCTDYISYYDWGDHNHDVDFYDIDISFKGFKADGIKNIALQDNSCVRNDSGDPYCRFNLESFTSNSSYNETYKITELITNELEMSSSGVAKGKIYVNCKYGCSEEFDIYFDLSHEDTENKVVSYNLTLLSEEEGKYGYVGINTDNPTLEKDSKPVPEGSLPTINAVAKSGYVFDGWYKPGNEDATYGKAKRSITMPGYDYILIARFKPADRHNIKVYSDGNGKVQIGQDEGDKLDIDVPSGSDLKIESNPNSGFKVDYWEIIEGTPPDDTNNEDLVLEDIRQNYEIIVHFKPTGPNDPPSPPGSEEYYKLTIKANGPGEVIGGTEYAVSGEKYPVEAIPDEEAQFLYWKDDDNQILDIGSSGYIEMPDRNYTVTAYFGDKYANFGDESYTITVKTDGGGEVSIDNRTPVTDKDSITSNNGEEHRIKAEPQDGYEFNGWFDEEGNKLPIDQEDYVRVDGDKVYIADFEFVGYTLEALSAGNGLVQIENRPLTTSDILKGIQRGTKITIKAYPDSDYKFDFWWNEKDKEKKYQQELNVTIEESEKYIAYFVYAGSDAYDLTVKSDGEGEVSIDNRPPVKDKDTIPVKPGSSHEIHANPDPGNEFDKWTDSKGKEDNPPKQKDDIVIVNKDEEYTAHFNKNGEYTLTLKSESNGVVSIGDEEPIYDEVWANVKEGTTIKINSDPNDGYVFSGWREEGTDITLEYDEDDEIFMPGNDYTLIVSFDLDKWCEIKVKSASPDGGNVSINGGEIKQEDSINVKVGEEVIIKAHPNPGWEFAYWLDSKGKQIDEKNYPLKASKSEEYIAYFSKDDNGGDDDTGEDGGSGGGDGYSYYKLEVRSAGNGTVKGSINNAIPGNKYKIEAIPNLGYDFFYWEDIDKGYTTYSKEDWVLMPHRHVTLDAYFYKDDSGDNYDLTLEAGDGCENPIGGGSYPPGTSVNISVTVKPGYKFSGWYEGNVKKYDDINEIIIIPNKDLTLKAIAVPINLTGTVDTFKILSIRDIRWMDYFSGGGNYIELPKNAGNKDIVNAAALKNSDFNKYKDIVFGYAVEFEMKTSGVGLYDTSSKLLGSTNTIDPNGVRLVIEPAIYEKKSYGNPTLLTVKSNLDNGMISSTDSEAVKQFMIKAKTSTEFNNGISYPVITWNWVYYLPLDVYETILSKVSDDDSDIVIRLKMSLKDGEREIFNYTDSLNTIYGVNWSGNVFTYKLRKDGKPFTLINDIYDNATN